MPEHFDEHMNMQPDPGLQQMQDPSLAGGHQPDPAGPAPDLHHPDLHHLHQPEAHLASVESAVHAFIDIGQGAAASFVANVLPPDAVHGVQHAIDVGLAAAPPVVEHVLHQAAQVWDDSHLIANVVPPDHGNQGPQVDHVANVAPPAIDHAHVHLQPGNDGANNQHDVVYVPPPEHHDPVASQPVIAQPPELQQSHDHVSATETHSVDFRADEHISDMYVINTHGNHFMETIDTARLPNDDLRIDLGHGTVVIVPKDHVHDVAFSIEPSHDSTHVGYVTINTPVPLQIDAGQWQVAENVVGPPTRQEPHEHGAHHHVAGHHPHHASSAEPSTHHHSSHDHATHDAPASSPAMPPHDEAPGGQGYVQFVPPPDVHTSDPSAWWNGPPLDTHHPPSIDPAEASRQEINRNAMQAGLAPPFQEPNFRPTPWENENASKPGVEKILDPRTGYIIGYSHHASGVWDVHKRDGTYVGGGEYGLEQGLVDNLAVDLPAMILTGGGSVLGRGILEAGEEAGVDAIGETAGKQSLKGLVDDAQTQLTRAAAKEVEEEGALTAGRGAAQEGSAQAADAFEVANKAAKDVLTNGRQPVSASQLGSLGKVRSNGAFRKALVRKISSPDHPLHQLLAPDGKLVQSTAKGMGEEVWLERPEIVEVGHGTSKWFLKLTGGRPHLSVQSAYLNRLSSAALETHGGANLGFPVVEIGDVPIELQTARDLVAKGLLAPEHLASARVVAY